MLLSRARTSDVPASAAFVRFRSCRGSSHVERHPGLLPHREVKPYPMPGSTPRVLPPCHSYNLRHAKK